MYIDLRGTIIIVIIWTLGTFLAVPETETATVVIIIALVNVAACNRRLLQERINALWQPRRR